MKKRSKSKNLYENPYIVLEKAVKMFHNILSVFQFIFVAIINQHEQKYLTEEMQ